jgi:hypothetical protein
MISQFLRCLNHEPNVSAFDSGAIRERVGNDDVSEAIEIFEMKLCDVARKFIGRGP